MLRRSENLKRLAGTLGIFGSLIGVGALVLIAIATFAPSMLDFAMFFPEDASSLSKRVEPGELSDSYGGNCIARPTLPGATPKGFGTFQVDCLNGNTTNVTIDQRTSTSSQ